MGEKTQELPAHWRQCAGDSVEDEPLASVMGLVHAGAGGAAVAAAAAAAGGVGSG